MTIEEQIFANDAIEAAKAVALEEARQTALPTPDVPVPPPLPRVIPWRPWYVRLREYGLRQIVQPKRIVRWLAWWWRLPFRFASFAWAVTGTRLDVTEEWNRNGVCADCPQRYVGLTKGGKAYDYCGKCECPPWRFARLAVKNRLARWKCPLHKHEGAYRDDPQRDWLKGAGYDADKVLGTSACVGCGCGKAAGTNTTA